VLPAYLPCQAVRTDLSGLAPVVLIADRSVRDQTGWEGSCLFYPFSRELAPCPGLQFSRSRFEGDLLRPLFVSYFDM
jgi:hypothetical protein